jgi:ferric-dicitrate binding protein FerR (iron transport regulator)
LKRYLLLLLVKTDQISIRVKGTKFNVRAYEGEDANTTLEEGKVELTVSGQDQTYSMRPGDQITVAKKEQKITFQKVNPANFSAWKEDTLVFDNTPLSQIILKLENRYKVKIVIDQALAERERLTMTISQESIDEILEMIQLSSRLNYRKEKNHIVIYE